MKRLVCTRIFLVKGNMTCRVAMQTCGSQRSVIRQCRTTKIDGYKNHYRIVEMERCRCSDGSVDFQKDVEGLLPLLGAAAAERCCVQVAWDLDNVRPPTPRGIRRLLEKIEFLWNEGEEMAIEEEEAGEAKEGEGGKGKGREKQVVEVVVAGNEGTILSLGGGSPGSDLVPWNDTQSRWSATLVQTTKRRQSADLELIARMHSFAVQHKEQGLLVCVSNDTDFAKVLGYATSLGVLTVSVEKEKSRKKRKFLQALGRCVGHNKTLVASTCASMVVSSEDGGEWDILSVRTNDSMNQF